MSLNQTIKSRKNAASMKTFDLIRNLKIPQSCKMKSTRSRSHFNFKVIQTPNQDNIFTKRQIKSEFKARPTLI